MSLQSRLADLVAAVGADIKAVNARIPANFPTNIGMDTWHQVGASGEPVFANGWLNYDAGGLRNARFRKYPDGKVRLAGIVKTGASGSAIFTLPAGYRPAATQPFVTLMSPGTNTFAEVDITAAGAVVPNGAAVATFVSLDGIEFDTESVSQTVSVAAQPLDPLHLVGAAGEPAFQNGWINNGGGYHVIAFRKDPQGRVRISGGMKNGTIGAPAFTLPVGYRPPSTVIFVVYSNNAFGALQIATDGTVQVFTGNNASVFFDGVEFDTETVSNYTTGVIAAPTPALFQGQRTTDFAIGGAGYTGPVGFDELYDSNNWYDGVKFNPKLAGWYQINACMVFSGLGVSNPEVILAKNGTIANAGTTAGVASSVLATRADNWAGGNLSKLVFMNGTTDYLEIYCYTATAATVRGASNERTFFEGVFVRP